MLQAFFQALVITLREGFEAFLIVAISLAYLRKSGRSRLTPAVHWGIAAAVAASVLGGYLLFHAPNQELLDGPLAIVAAEFGDPGATLGTAAIAERVSGRDHRPIGLAPLGELQARGAAVDLGVANRAGHAGIPFETAYGKYTARTWKDKSG